MPTWSVHLLDDLAEAVAAMEQGEVLALDLDPRHPRVLLRTRQPGLGDAEVGQRAVYRRWLGASGEEAIQEDELHAIVAQAGAWLGGTTAASLLQRVGAGYRCTRHWTGDELGEWTSDAWAAADAIFMGVVGAMEAIDAARSAPTS